MEYSNHPINLKIVTFIFGQRLYNKANFSGGGECNEKRLFATGNQ